MSRLLTDLDELVSQGASRDVIEKRVTLAIAQGIERGGVFDDLLATAINMSSIFPDEALRSMRTAITRASTKSKIKPIGRAGAKAKFDPDTMEGVTGVPKGAEVIVTRRGSSLTLPDGSILQIEKAQVRLVGPTREEVITRAQSVLANSGPNGPTAARMKATGLKYVGRPIDPPVVYDPLLHESRTAGVVIPQGAKVQITKPGYAVDYHGETVVVQKPVVKIVEWPDRGDFPSRDAMSLKDIADELAAARSTASGRYTPAMREAEAAALDRVSIAMNNTFGSLRAEVSSVMIGYSGEMQITGNIYKGRQYVGTFTRIVSTRKNSVEHAFLQIQPSVQGSGFAERFNGNLFDWYRRSGFKSVTVHANIDVGGYTWATQGFDFASAARAREFLDWAIRKINARGGNPPQGMDQTEFDALRTYIQDIIAGRIKASAPLIAKFGRKPGQGGKSSVWGGKWLMLGSNWYGKLPL